MSGSRVIEGRLTSKLKSDLTANSRDFSDNLTVSFARVLGTNRHEIGDLADTFTI
jgi:hypothetical protein